MDKEVILAVISLISAIASGWMLYKTNMNKDSVREKSKFLDAEQEFRADLLKENKTLRAKNEELIVKIEALSMEINALKDRINELELKLTKRIDKLKVIANFLKYLPVPAWLKTKNNHDFKIVSVNSSYSVLFDVSEDYVKSSGDHTHLPEDLKKHFETMEERVQKNQKGLRTKSPLKIKNTNCNWYLVKFPIIEDGEIIAIGGVLIDCEC